MTNVEIEYGDVRYALAADAGTSNRSHVKMSSVRATVIGLRPYVSESALATAT